MANSIVTANVEIQIQDALQSSIPSVLFRTVPPIAYPSTFQVAYNGYTQLNSGGSQVIISGLNFPFVYVRNAGVRGTILISALGEAAGSQTIDVQLSPGGVWLFANPANIPFNSISALTIAPVGANPIVAEWLIAQ